MEAAVKAADPVTARQERGRLLAQRLRITRKASGLYVVPASSSPGSYIVEPESQHCTCPDHELHAGRCKHLWAVEYSRRSETMADGSEKVTETLRVTYSQNWTAYNAAQTHEKEHALKLLRALCDGYGFVQPPARRGEQPLPMADRVFAIVAKVYGGMSTRRTDTDMRDYAARGLLSRAPSYNSIIRFMDDPDMAPILRRLVQESAAPLAAVEHSFAVDSTGFSTCTYRRWYDEKYGKEHSEALWTKAHLCVGTKTNVITDAVVTDEANGADCPQLPALLGGTALHFKPREVLADKAYLSGDNQRAISEIGAAPFIPFKSNSVMETASHKHRAADRELWQRLLAYFNFQRPEFLRHYNQRSNVEATNSAVKRKFGPALKSKTFTAQVNETYAKLLCFNLSCLVHEMYELGIVPMFWQDDADKGSGNVISLRARQLEAASQT